MKRLICIDLDGTLTQHRTKIEKANKELLKKLDELYKVVIVSAGTAERVFSQIGEYPVDIIGNYGMEEARVIDGKLKVVKEIIADTDKKYFVEKTDLIREKYGYTDFKGASVYFYDSGMVTFPILGYDAELEEKLAFDPTKEKRRAIFAEVLEMFPDYTVYISGTTSFDFSEKNINKYDAIMSYAAENGYSKEEILFVGDDFGDGGGDSHVRLGGMDYVEIKDYRDLPNELSSLLQA